MTNKENAAAIARTVQANEREQLLELYKFLQPDDPELDQGPSLDELWEAMLADPTMKIVVVEYEGRLVATCVLVLVKNLTRGARPYGLIENVVTHEAYRKMGFGGKVLQKALEFAKEAQCYKVMLLTSKTDEALYRFYESHGFKRGIKTGFQCSLE